MAWYKEWFGEEYLDLYAHRDAGEAERHVDFVERVLEGRCEPPHAVLDLACGAGRHTAALRKRGRRALGIDLSLTLLMHDRRQPGVAGDMRELPFSDSTFDWVLNFFTSFGYFESERENARVLEEVARVLTPSGWFLIDLFNREHVISTLIPREHTTNDGRDVTIERWFDPVTERINKRIRVASGARSARTYVESVRAYRREEVLESLDRVGLEVLNAYGGFDGGPFEPSSERMIFIARKAA